MRHHHRGNHDQHEHGRPLLKRLSEHFVRHAMGRHGHGHGGHGGHGGPGGFDGDGEGLTRGRKFSSDDLQLLLLALLADKPSHGYELIKALETQSKGVYSPSPGMVYPALTYLEELGYATVEVVSNKKCYQLADAGREYLDAQRERLALIQDKLKHLAHKMEWLRRAMSGEEDGESGSSWLPEFVEARRALKRALMQRSDVSADEQRRIAAILARATQDIINPGSSQG
ncbi:PadR family transcriptional regulator [Chitinimonas naiadis]